MTVTTPICKEDVSLLGFMFVDNADLVSGADDVHTTGATMITNSDIPQRMNYWACLGNWTDPLVREKRQWWRSPLEDRLYKYNGDDWLLYMK